MARFWEMKGNGTGEKASSLCRFDERSRRENHFVVHLKRNSPGGSRPFGNETSECGLTRFTFRCPNTVGNFLEWSVPDYGACSIPKVTRRTCPPHELHRGGRLVPTALFNESASEFGCTLHPRIVPFRDSDFIATLSSPTTLNVTYRNFDFPHTR